MRTASVRLRFSAVVVAAAMTSFACVSTTVIKTNPPGATIHSVEGGFNGTTPYTFSDSSIIGTTRKFTVEAPGYQSQDVIIKRDQWDSGRLVLSVVGGLFFLFPYIGILWSADYAPVYDVVMKPVGETTPEAPPVQTPGGPTML